MNTRYKHQTYHMMESFNQTGKSFLTKRCSQASPQQMRGQNGNTWDAKHLASFLSKSQYSNRDALSFSTSRANSTHRRAISTHDHFFKTTKDNKNASKIGFTPINPLVANIQTSRNRVKPIQDYLQSPLRAPKPDLLDLQNHRFQGNTVKFRKTDPLTNHNVQDISPTGFDKERMLRLISQRHPHGITGLDHPQSPQTKYYNGRNFSQTTRIRMEPNSLRTHIIDPRWKSKGRNSNFDQCPIYGGERVKLSQVRKFNNDDAHGFDIINNRVRADIIKD